MKTAKNIIIPYLYALVGFLIGLTLIKIFPINIWITIIISTIISFNFYKIGKRSMVEIDGEKFYAIRKFSGELGNKFLESGYRHFWLGFFNKTVLFFLKGDFGYSNEMPPVEHRVTVPKKIEDKYTALENLFTYQMKIKYVVTLKIGEHNIIYSVDGNHKNRDNSRTKIEQVKNFWILTGGVEIKESVIDIEKSEDQFIKKVDVDIRSTISLIAMSKGFIFMQSNSDWTLEELIMQARDSAKDSKNQNYNPDSLQDTLFNYSIELVSVNTEVSLEENAEKIIKDIANEKTKQKRELIAAETLAKTKVIDAYAEARKILVKGRSETAVKAWDVKRVGAATTEAVTKSLDGYISRDIEKPAALLQSSLDNNSYTNEQLFVGSDSQGNPLKGMLIEKGLPGGDALNGLSSQLLAKLNSPEKMREFMSEIPKNDLESLLKIIKDILTSK